MVVYPVYSEFLVWKWYTDSVLQPLKSSLVMTMPFLLLDVPALAMCPSYGNESNTGPLCVIVLQLIKTHNLLPSRNYIFGYHPHGIFCFGAFCNFGTEATGFSKKFPGIKPSLATLAGNFRMPVLRDYLMSGGEILWEAMESCNV